MYRVEGLDSVAGDGSLGRGAVTAQKWQSTLLDAMKPFIQISVGTGVPGEVHAITRE